MDLAFNSSSLALPISAIVNSVTMQFLTSALLLGSVAFQGVFGRPGHAKRNDLNDFVPWEANVALHKLLCNIGPDGCEAEKAHAGVVIASPSTEDPNCRSTNLGQS